MKIALNTKTMRWQLNLEMNLNLEKVYNETRTNTNSQVNSRIKPDLTEVIESNQYIQNEEQGENSIWKRIKDNE